MRSYFDPIGPNQVLWQRVIASKGKLESGMIADMKRYYLRSTIIHTRLLAEGKTLCGVSCVNNDQWAWQFIHRGDVAAGNPPSGARGKDRSCKRCMRSPILRATFAICDARVEALFKARKEVLRHGRGSTTRRNRKPRSRDRTR